MSPRTNILLGGAGLIGRALQSELKTLGERTVVLDLKGGFDLREIEPEHHGNEAYYWFLAWDVGGARYIMDPNRQIDILRNNLRLCEKVFGWMERRNACGTFISTQMVGYPNAYGVTKQVGEIWAQHMERVIVARLWNVYGAESVSNRTHLIPDLVWQGAQGRIRLQTNGRERRQFIHARDCARGLLAHRACGRKLVDITDSKWTPVYDVARATADIMGASLEVAAERGYESLIEPERLVPDWEPSIALHDGIRLVINEMRAQGWLDGRAADASLRQPVTTLP